MLINTKIKMPISNFNQTFNLNSINLDSNELCTLAINEDEGIISCSQTEINENFGSYISSLIKGDFSINILSISNKILYSSKNFLLGENGLPDKKYEKYIMINEEIQPNCLFLINLKIP